MIVPITYELGEWLFRKYTTIQDIEDIGWMSAKKAIYHIKTLTFTLGLNEKEQEKMVKDMSKLLNRVKVGKGKSTRYYYKNDEIVAYSVYMKSKDEEVVSNAVIGTQLVVQGYISEYLLKLNLHRIFKDNKIKEYMSNAEFAEIELSVLRENIQSVCVGEKHKTWYYSMSDFYKFYKQRLQELKG